MKLHSQAALTIKQRQEVKRLHYEEKLSVRILAKKFAVNPTTIQRWIHRSSPLDLSSAPINPKKVITAAYRKAVIDYRKNHPKHGPIQIVAELETKFEFANRGTILKILQEEGLTRPVKKEKKKHKEIPVGHHRIQMDIQQLPAVKGGKGFEYKISAIHTRTRMKYSEIHPNRKSKTVASVLERALDLLPPFSLYGPTMDVNSL